MDYATGQVLAGENVDTARRAGQHHQGDDLLRGRRRDEDRQDQARRPGDDQRERLAPGGAGTDGSYSGFEVNQTAPLEDMENGMVVQSGNDAAIALAEHVAGSEEAFAALMNSYAARLGMKNTHFVNSHGLPAREPLHHRARPRAARPRADPRFPGDLRATTRSRNSPSAPSPSTTATRCCGATPRVDGIKTGHTSSAGYCLLASAKRGDQRLIAW